VNTIFKRALITVVASIAVGALVSACNGGTSHADDDSGYVTVAQAKQIAAQAAASAVSAAVAPLNARLKRLEALRLAVSHGGSTVITRGVTHAAASSTTSSWTRANLQVQQGMLWIISGTGCYARISEAVSGDYGYVQPLSGGITIGFTGSGCTGTGYVMGMSVGAAASGIVFTLNPQNSQGMSGSDWNNAAYYWYIASGSVYTSFQEMSYWQPGGGCIGAGGTAVSNTGMQMLQNDATVTNVPSAPVLGPLLPSNV